MGSPIELPAHVYSRLPCLCLSASRRLQRIHRSSGFCRAFRRVWRHEKAALTIQRVVRGHYARCYFRVRPAK